MTDDTVKIQFTEGQHALRLDQALAQLFPDRSRSQLQQWIRDGLVLVDGVRLRQRDKVASGAVAEIRIPHEPAGNWQAQDIPLTIVYEDEDVLVLDKPAGLVVHPGAGNPEGTLLNALLHHVPGIEQLPRAGIVHRLDKDTTGLLVVAKTEATRLDLIDQLQQRSLAREYLAVVNGIVIAGASIDAAIGRHARDRTRMAVTERGKPALTHYRVRAKYRAHTLLQCQLATGRTHQIRVHMAWIRHPIVGDPVYGGRLQLPRGSNEDLRQVLREFPRQALHAQRLGLRHPGTGEDMSWESPLPLDMQQLIAALEQDLALQKGHK